MDPDTDVRVVLVTAPTVEVAVELARGAVEAGLAACGNLVPGIRSIYAWNGSIHDDAEVLVVFKTTAARVAALTAQVAEAHPYDCPEVLALPVTAGHGPYLDWVSSQTGGSP